ncbi:MAG: hypothetical protein ACRDGA_12640, partial [Bacteroidota bacterium]
SMESGGRGGQLQINPALINDYSAALEANLVPATETVVRDAMAAASVSPEIVASATTLGQTLSTNTMTAMNDGLASGDITPETIGAEITNPIIEAFSLAFGPEGTVTLQWTTFATTIGTDLAVMGTNFVNMKNIAVGALGDVTAKVQDWGARSKSAIFGVAGAINTLITAIHGLQDAIGSLSTTNIGLPTVPVSGQMAAGGTALGGHNYLVGERGPELFIPGTTGSIIPNNALAAVGASSAPVVVNIYDANDVDAILFELKRRGIRIVG